MTGEIRLLPSARNDIKKIQDKKLKSELLSAIEIISQDYTVGKPKIGDLSGICGYDVFYNKTNYEIAYTVHKLDGMAIVIILVGTREKFYQELKRYIKMVD